MSPAGSSRSGGPLGVAEYSRQVHRALADLPPAALEELLEDLDGHLAEVAAESGGALETTLGSPAGYAAELRRAAGLPPPDAPPQAAPIDRLSEAAQRAGRHDAVRAVLAFLPELRPAWWVLRGWLAVVALGTVFGFPSLVFPFGVLGLPLIAAAVVLSVRLGRRSQARPAVEGRQRLVALAGNAALALLAAVALFGVQQRAQPVYAGDPPAGYYGYRNGYDAGGTLTRQDGTPITNIYPYTAAGQPLTGVLLYDQDGQALDNLSPTTATGCPSSGSSRPAHRPRPPTPTRNSSAPPPTTRRARTAAHHLPRSGQVPCPAPRPRSPRTRLARPCHPAQPCRPARPCRPAQL